MDINRRGISASGPGRHQAQAQTHTLRHDRVRQDRLPADAQEKGRMPDPDCRKVM